MTFAEALKRGQLGEGVIANWIKVRGNSVLPVYEKQIDTGKGPQFFTPDGAFVAPDMFVMPSMHWVEAKNKSVFTWHRITRRWVTGIDLHHYAEYQRVAEISRRPVWLLFLHTSNVPDRRDLDMGCPTECPVGLFGASLKFLIRNENHRHHNHGRYGMVYWAHGTLSLMATVDELAAIMVPRRSPTPSSASLAPARGDSSHVARLRALPDTTREGADVA